VPDQAASEVETWLVRIGETARGFIQGIDFLSDEQRKENILVESQKILSRCSNPNKNVSRKSILILGEVQSGKTLSFTSVIALARDNEIPITILLAGTKRPLMKQNYEQLVKDLNRNSSGSAPQWFITNNTKNDVKEAVIESLKSWFNPNTPSQFKKAIVIASMKTPAGVKKVTNFLKQVQDELGKTLPCLIIDDEGDQASPNTKVAQDEFSSTYAAISDLRDSLQNHSFLSYTATPEANLLLSLSDHLSPESVVVLSPGEEYVGGYKLFVDKSVQNKFSIEIPDDELGVATKPKFGDLPPKSLVSALAYFLVCMTVAQKKYEKVRPISMLIHPDSTIDSHTKYKKWVNSIINKWIMHFDENDLDSPNYKIPNDFGTAIVNLRKTVDLSNIFPDIGNHNQELELLKLIKFWIKPDYLEVRVVNSESSKHNVSPDEWNTKSGWILIGAGKLDRGFVVKNLSVTYMPRGIGGGNVDTIQQRGRFFGYKSNYLELLRGWFSKELINSYASIVETETALRNNLRKYDSGSLNLMGWKRSMIMDPSLTPTRKNIISLSHSTLNLKAGAWFQQRQIFDPYLHSRAEELRTELVAYMEDSIESILDTRHGEKKHKVLRMPLPKIVELLLNWPIAAGDKENLSKYLVILSNFAQAQSSTSGEIFFMNQLEPRFRKVDESSLIANPQNKKLWRIQNLHEGPRTSGRTNYLGDKSIRNTEAISLQIHCVKPRKDDSEKVNTECFAIAITWPNGFEKKVLEQLN
jgi:hypothetical protein